MKKLENFIEEVEKIGSVFEYSTPVTLSDWDALIRRFSTMGISGEVMYYCSPKLVQETLDLLDEVSAHLEGGVSYGQFHLKDNSWSFLVEASFLRGSYTIHLVSKEMEGGVLIPTLPEEEWGTEQLAKSSIKIQTCQ